MTPPAPSPAAARPRVAIAGLGIESSTFSPARTDAAAFHPVRGAEILERYAAFLGPGTPLHDAAQWLPVLVGKALPGGTVTADAYAALSGEILAGLRALVAEAPLDGLWFDIHGAMTVEGLDDAEASLLRQVRGVVGPDCLVATTMDLHGNVSRDLATLTDLVTCYRTAPHVDVDETRARGVGQLVDRLRSRAGRPLKAWVPVPVLLPGEKTSTRVEPARSLYLRVADVAARPGVLDAALWVGYAWADEPRNRAAVVVTGDDEVAVRAGAEEIARGFWDARDEFTFVAPAGPFDGCVDDALRAADAGARPFFLSDSGDNPTAGGAGDVTWTLARLLERPELVSQGRTVIYASLPAASGIDTAIDAGVGARVTLTVGAEVDAVHEGPVTLTGVVHAVRHGDRDAADEVVLRVGGNGEPGDRSGLFVILTRRRKPYHLEADFTALDLDPRAADVVIVKIGYLEPELYAMAADWRLMLTPGGVDQDLLRLGHHRLERPIVPFDAGDFTPDLTARLV